MLSDMLVGQSLHTLVITRDGTNPMQAMTAQPERDVTFKA